MSSDVQAKCRKGLIRPSSASWPRRSRDEVLDGLDVVIGAALDLLDAAGIIGREIAGYPVQHLIDDRGQRPEVVNGGSRRQKLHPAHFRQHTETDQAVLAEDFPEGISPGGVTAVERGEGGERVAIHARLCKKPL